MRVPFAAPGVPVTLKPLEPRKPPCTLDSRELGRLNGQSLADQTARFNQRMEERPATPAIQRDGTAR